MKPDEIQSRRRFFSNMRKWSLAIAGIVLGSASESMARDLGTGRFQRGPSLGRSVRSGDGEASDPTRKIGSSLGRSVRSGDGEPTDPTRAIGGSLGRSIRSGDGEASDPTRKFGGSLGRSIRSGDGEPTDPTRTIQPK